MTHCRFVFCPSDESCEEKIKSTHLPSHYCSMSVTFTGCITSCRFLYSSVHRSVTQTSIWSGLVLICEMCVSFPSLSIAPALVGVSPCVCAGCGGCVLHAGARDPSAQDEEAEPAGRERTGLHELPLRRVVIQVPKHPDWCDTANTHCKSSLTITDLLRNASWKTSTCEREILYLCIY